MKSEDLEQPEHLHCPIRTSSVHFWNIEHYWIWASAWQKPTKEHESPAQTLIRLGIRPVWSEASLCAQWVVKDPSFLHADSEDSDQTGRMPRLSWVFAGICHFVGLSCAGSQRAAKTLIALCGLTVRLGSFQFIYVMSWFLIDEAHLENYFWDILCTV